MTDTPPITAAKRHALHELHKAGCFVAEPSLFGK
jgi:hypothetical protein